jgi:5'-3' exonuclease
MGIPSYFSFIVKNHKGIIKKLRRLGRSVDNLYLDSNSVIYDRLRSLHAEYREGEDAAFEELLIRAVCTQLDEYIRVVRPRNEVLIAFDGVAPVAKLEQQRTRRYKSALLERVRQRVDPCAQRGWDKTAITPGTSFMEKLGVGVRAHYADGQNRRSARLVSVTCSDEPGEGEHKIFQHIRDEPGRHADEVTLVYGLDADLIMLALNHLPISKTIYLYRETPEFIKSIDAHLEPNESYVLDIPQLADAVVCNMGGGSFDEDPTRMYDYIFLCFFLGNDFMPHFPSANIRTTGIAQLLEAYQSVVSSKGLRLIDNATVLWDNVRSLVLELAGGERSALLAEHRRRDRWERRSRRASTPEEKMARLDQIPTQVRDLEHYIDPSRDGWERRYYQTLLGFDQTDAHIKPLCTNYIEGLEWTMRYYMEGCVDWSWCYRYHYPPLFRDLARFIPRWETRMLAPSNSRPVGPLTQLAYVLPLSGLHLLPSSLRVHLLKSVPGNYTFEHPIYWSYCRYLWEAHVGFPHLNVRDLELLTYGSQGK